MPDKREQEFENLMSRLGGHMSPEQQAQVRQAFAQAPEAMALLGEEVLAKQDYGRLIREANGLRTQAQAEAQRIEQERQELAELATKVQEYERYLQSTALPRDQYEQLKQERDLLANKVAQLSTQYPALAEELELEPSSNGGTKTMPASNEGNQNQPFGGQAGQQAPSTPFQPVNTIAYQRDQQNMAALAMLTPAAMNDLAVKHQQLFGEPLADMTSLIKDATSSGRSIEDVWTEKYQVAERMQKLDAERVEQEVQTRVKAELAKALSGQVVNGGVGTLPGSAQSPFLQRLQPGADGRDPFAPDPNRIANQGTGVGEGARRAAEAWQSGKYRNEKFDLLTTS